MKEVNEILKNLVGTYRYTEIDVSAELESLDSKKNLVTFRLRDLDMKMFLRYLQELDNDSPVFTLKFRLEDYNASLGD